MAKILVSGELWRSMGGKFDAPLPDDYVLEEPQYDAIEDMVTLPVVVPRAVAEVLTPWYMDDVNGTLKLDRVQGDPLYDGALR